MNKKSFIFLYLKTGGGHLAPARSLSKYIDKSYSSEFNSLLVDGFEKTPRIIRYIIEDGYRKLQAGAKWYYEFLYALNKIPIIARVTAYIIMIFCSRHIEDTILKEKPEKIVILHFFLIKPVYKILKKHNLDIPAYTVVTDPYTAHPLWFLVKNQNFIVFSKRLEEYVQKKVEYNSLKVFPFILDEKFSDKVPAEKIPDIKNKFNIPAGDKIVLVLGGGDGIPHGKKILKEMLNADLNAVVIVVCGRNKKLRKTAGRLKTKYNNEKLIIYGFVDFVYELLNISDIVVTKCGASTMMEILMMNKVAMVNDYIWEQEKGNIEFLIMNNFGLYEPDIIAMVNTLKNLIDNEQYYNELKGNITNANLENGLTSVAEYLMNK
jgi:processive 1,2-diacylglycerol beta-glucosyltransferase/1,2-diacylglycerol 3-beta-galactosyltransferase